MTPDSRRRAGSHAAPPRVECGRERGGGRRPGGRRLRAKKDREIRAHLPGGTLVAIAGGKTVADPGAVIARLDKARAKYADLVLVHGGGPGIDRVAAQWADRCDARNGVHQVVCKPDWGRHGLAPPRSAGTTNC